MPKTTTPIGPVSAAYIGLTTQATALTQLTSVMSGGAVFSENLPSNYVLSQNAPVQEGDHTISLSLNFLGKKDEITKLLRGLSPFSTNINAPIGQTLYAVMVFGPDPTSGGNYYLPRAWTEKITEVRMSKNSPTVTSVIFRAQNPDVTVSLHTEGTLTDMASASGGQYPI